MIDKIISFLLFTLTFSAGYAILHNTIGEGQRYNEI